MKITQKQVGQRIMTLRKNKGISQEELAKSINISRSSFVQIELGNRGIDIVELHKIAQVLGFSMDSLLSEDFKVENHIMINEPEVDKNKKEIRISVPKIKTSKFKNVLLYILEKCAGKPNVGETVLYKLLYFSDFNYYETYEEHLTGALYRKLPFGPVPQKMDSIVSQMIETKEIQRIKTDYHGYPQTRYIPLVKSDLTELKASEKEIIDRVIDQLSDLTATAISNYSHKDMPWLASKENEDINYELVFYREPPYSVRNYGDENEEL